MPKKRCKFFLLFGDDIFDIASIFLSSDSIPVELTICPKNLTDETHILDFSRLSVTDNENNV